MQLSVDNASSSATLQLAGENTSIRKEIPLPQGKDSGFGFVTLPHDDLIRDDISFFTFAPKPLANILIFGPSGEVGKTLSLMSAPPGPVSYTHLGPACGHPGPSPGRSGSGADEEIPVLLLRL